MSDAFSGQWVTRPGGVRVPVVADVKPKQRCRVCGSPSPVGLCRPCRDSARERVHGSHAGHAQHVRRNESPCASCESAEKKYQNARYRKGSLSNETRQWCERQAVAWSWVQYGRENRSSVE